MDAHSPSSAECLVDHLLFVGPGRGLIFEPPGAFSHRNPASSWYTIHSPQPTILRSFPSPSSEEEREEEEREGGKSTSLTGDVAFFCQPDGCSVELAEQRVHHFMLTDKESNRRTFGICLSFPHLFDPLQGPPELGEEGSEGGGGVCPVTLSDSSSVCIQEWGILSLCVLSRHPFFSFLHKALLSLQHFVDHFFGEDLTWNALIHGGGRRRRRGGEEGEVGAAGKAVVEVERWIAQLLSMRAPRQGQSALEVELEVDPAVTVAVPPTNRLPLLDLPVSRLFLKLGVCTVIEIFKLVLSEQKVILYSADVSFVSESVLVLLSLLYPLQYLFPSIPLLPTSMPTAENVLMVPTPFFIGVHKSFVDRMGTLQHTEAWMVDLDSKHLEPPSFTDQQIIPEFPYSILQLQADIRKVLDSLEREEETDDWDGMGDNQSIRSFTAHPTTTADDHLNSLAEDVDVMIRIAFVEFLFSPEILGCTEQYMCIYRLFTRPVVAIKPTAFIHGYQKTCPATNTEFIKNLIRSQGIEYFFEWCLNPSNSAFNEIRRGIHAVERLSDKQYHYVHKSGLSIHQVCLYTLSDDSLLYQEMLAYKASHASYYLVSSTDLPSEEDEDDSDWELLAANRHTNSVELPMSSPSYTSEDHTSSFSLGGAVSYPTHRLLVTSGTPPPHSAAERYLQEADIGGVGFFPSSSSSTTTTHHHHHQVAEAEVHVSRVSPPLPPSAEEKKEREEKEGEVVSTSIRVRSSSGRTDDDEFSTPRASLNNDPSPLSAVVNTATPATRGVLSGTTLSLPVPSSSSLSSLSLERKSAFHPTTGKSAVGGSQGLQSLQSLQLPPGPRKRIVISPGASSSSCDVSCDGDDSEITSEDSEFDGPRTNFRPSSHGAAAVPPRLKNKWGGSQEFFTPGGGGPPQLGGAPRRSHSVSPTPVESYSEDDTVLVTRRRVNATPHHHNQHRSFFNLSPAPSSMEVVEFSTPMGGATPASSSSGGLGRSASMRLSRERTPSPAYSAIHRAHPSPVATMSRTIPLSAITQTQSLEYQIQELVQKLIDGQGLPLIKPPALRRMAGYEKTRVMVLRRLETQVGVRRAGEMKMASHPQILPVGVTRPVYRGLLDLFKYFLQSVEDELHKEPEASIFSVFVLLRIAVSVYLLPKGGKFKTSPEQRISKTTQHDPSSISFLPPISISPASLTPGKTIAVSNSPNRSPVMSRKMNIGEDSPRYSPHHSSREATPQCGSENRESTSYTPGVGTGDETGSDTGDEKRGDIIRKRDDVIRHLDNTPTPKTSLDMNDVTIYHTPSSSTTPLRKIPNRSPGSPFSRSNNYNNATSESDSQSDSGSTSRRRHAHHPCHNPSSPLVAMHRRLRSEVDLNRTGTSFTKDTPFLYKDLMKALGANGRAFMMERNFWSILFMSVVSVERGYLGWNENTAELYQRYNSLSEAHRQAFGADEDYLLSLVLHNLLVYMLALGKSAGDTTDVVHRLTARARLATVEEKQLQKTLKFVEQNSSSELDLSDIGLMSLYSEVHPTASYIVHYGVNMIAPVYKLQITSECLILRRFPDEKISTRLWNDRISAISNNDRCATVTIHYHDNGGECKHHFHSKEFLKVYESLQILVSVGTILS